MRNPPAVSQIKLGSNMTVGTYDESSTVSAMDYVAQNMEKAELKESKGGTYDKSGMADRVLQ